MRTACMPFRTSDDGQGPEKQAILMHGLVSTNVHGQTDARSNLF